MSNEDDKVQRISLGALEDTGEVLRQANEAVVVHELRRALQRQAERDIVINDLRAVQDALIASSLVARDKIDGLERAVGVLVRQQQELHERQDIITAVCDAFVERLNKSNEAIAKLAEDVADRD